LLATPVAEQLAARLGHRIATLVAAATLTVSLAGMAWAVPHGYAAIAAAMVGMTIGLRTIMTICAIALVDAMPVNRTSVGAALNDTAQEVGTSVGIAVVGTVLAAALGTAGVGGWDSATIAAFLHGERLAFVLLAVIVGLVATYGANTLTDSRSIEES
jgi:MFS family permease